MAPGEGGGETSAAGMWAQEAGGKVLFSCLLSDGWGGEGGEPGARATRGRRGTGRPRSPQAACYGEGGRGRELS